MSETLKLAYCKQKRDKDWPCVSVCKMNSESLLSPWLSHIRKHCMNACRIEVNCSTKISVSTTLSFSF